MSDESIVNVTDPVAAPTTMRQMVALKLDAARTALTVAQNALNALEDQAATLPPQMLDLPQDEAIAKVQGWFA